MTQMEIKVLFRMSKEIPAKYDIVQIGKYSIESIPSRTGDQADEYQYILRFFDEMRNGENFSQPEMNSEFFLSFFSVITQSRLEIDEWMGNNVRGPQAPEQRDALHQYLSSQIEPLPDFNHYLNKFQNLDKDTARQFLRACEVYRLSLNISSWNKTISFFLLCVAIECLSNKLSKGNGNCDKFITFILTNLQEKNEIQTDDEWREILKEIYERHRSGFVHGGKSIPAASNLADKHNRIYVTNYLDGKYIKTPGFKWFSTIVHKTLIGFLNTITITNDTTTDHFKEISLESGTVRLKAKKNIHAGHLVTADDVEL